MCTAVWHGEADAGNQYIWMQTPIPLTSASLIQTVRSFRVTSWGDRLRGGDRLWARSSEALYLDV